MRRAMTLAAAAAVVLSGCAHTAPPLPAALPSASTTPSTTASASPSPSASASAPRSSATPSSTVALPSVAPKVLATLKLPDKFGPYQANGTTGTGEQQLVYVNPTDATDTLTVVVTGLADAGTIASAYAGATVNGPAVCGTVASGSTKIASCAMPLDKGAVIVTGAGPQSVDAVSTASGTLWAALP
ncbi:MAG TPA: hypothetical protein VFK68_11335 [Propionibacteriaceae bacterium]|nr:hypothetical protein [Propionibacteriaceae bacterium]